MASAIAYSARSTRIWSLRNVSWATALQTSRMIGANTTCRADLQHTHEAPKDVVLIYARWPGIGDFEVGLQNAGVPAYLYPDKFKPNGPHELSSVTFAVVWKPPDGLLGKCPLLRGVHSLGAGVDSVLPQLPKGIPLARVVDPLMAERMATWIVWAVINSHREMDAFKKSQEKKEWLQRGDFPPDNSDVNITVLGGLGAMGLPGCKALSTLGYSVCTCSRTSAKSGELEGFPSIRQITFAELDEQLPKTDVLICLLPLTDSTRGIISQGMLSKLKWGSTVVNAGRGAHVVEEDLVAALDSGQIAHAVLDVFEPEPLATESKLWSHPGVRITPHVSSPTNSATAIQLIADNFKRSAALEPMENVVDCGAGY